MQSRSLEEYSVHSDADLVRYARKGDQQAFGEVVRRHYRRCVNIATSILRNRGEAEEEAQNACWKAFAHLGQFQGEAEFSSWLFRIVENQCLMAIRRRRVQFVHLDNSDSENGTPPVQLASSAADPEGECGNVEVHDILQTEIRRIPPVLRNVFVLRDVQELSMDEVARQLGISIQAAKSRLLRARMELRNRMAKHRGRRGLCTLISKVAAPPNRVFHPSVRRAV